MQCCTYRCAYPLIVGSCWVRRMWRMHLVRMKHSTNLCCLATVIQARFQTRGICQGMKAGDIFRAPEASILQFICQIHEYNNMVMV